MPTDGEGLPREMLALPNAQDRCVHPPDKVRRMWQVVTQRWPYPPGGDWYYECALCGKGWWP